MYDPDEPTDPSRAKIADEIEKVAKRQHLSGIRREAFTDAVSLCNSCKWAEIRRRSSRNTREMRCSIFSGPCPEDIAECTEYSGHTSLSLNQMAEIATIIDVGEKKRVGFSNG